MQSTESDAGKLPNMLEERDLSDTGKEERGMGLQEGAFP